MKETSGSADRRPTVASVREELGRATYEELPRVIARYEEDERAQVAKMLESKRAHYARETKERLRVQAMYDLMYETAGGDDGIVLGVDEVGRGSVAGPLTVAAVALPRRPIVWGLNDSKKLTPQRREELAEVIRREALAVGIAHIEPEAIDACGMAASLRVAMKRAIENAGVEADCVLIDGMPVNIHCNEKTIVHGDARVACIAAASIVAKVTRDAIMVAQDEVYPGYYFAKSKGYASAEHIEAIRRLGLSPIHRATFCRDFV